VEYETNLSGQDAIMIEDGNWHPTRWWRAVGPDGQLWCEASDEEEVRNRARPEDRVERMYARTDSEWRPE
jgi:hypothetical protein